MTIIFSNAGENSLASVALKIQMETWNLTILLKVASTKMDELLIFLRAKGRLMVNDGPGRLVGRCEKPKFLDPVLTAEDVRAAFEKTISFFIARHPFNR